MKIDLEIHDLSGKGTGVGRDATGRIIFVPFTAPGDLVRVQIEKEEKKYAEGKLLEILRPSPLRVEPRCSAFGQCGGCEWQHLAYETQWQTKVKGLKHTLKRIGLEPEVNWKEFPAADPWHYRNRIQMRGFEEQIGFFARKSKNIVSVDHCWIARPEINALMEGTRQEGKSKSRPYKVELEVHEDGKTTATWNSSHSAKGFRQVFDAQNTVLQKWVKDSLSGTDLLLDLYGGSGNLSLGLAFTEIHCVDIGSPSGSPLEKDLLAKASSSSFHFHRSWVLPWLHNHKKQFHSRNISVVLDPPREGLAEDLIPIIEVLKELNVQEILVIGCDADSWTRIVSRLQRHGWSIQSLGALDFFPQTHHVEALARMQK